MHRVHRIVVAAVLAWFAATGLAVAEPISITSGIITLGREESAPITLSGTDGARLFAVNGDITDISFGAHECLPCFQGGLISRLTFLRSARFVVMSHTEQKATTSEASTTKTAHST
jgi:hypothetical protein